MKNAWKERAKELEELYEQTVASYEKENEILKVENKKLQELLSANSILLKDRWEIIERLREKIKELQYKR